MKTNYIFRIYENLKKECKVRYRHKWLPIIGWTWAPMKTPNNLPVSTRTILPPRIFKNKEEADDWIVDFVDREIKDKFSRINRIPDMPLPWPPPPPKRDDLTIVYSTRKAPNPFIKHGGTK